ncbi:hypothetical protein [Neosynechococcus sphagnicola]|uniref:hypothetical protein n=1 Tax=Neosynechococcus sphagnicola TaxID=1501145 RepID=UPI0030844922
MTHDSSPADRSLPAPCIIDRGIVLNKQDMQRLLTDLNRVRYLHLQDHEILSEGEGYVQAVFADPHRATLIANSTLYLNVHSFDYLELQKLSHTGIVV